MKPHKINQKVQHINKLGLPKTMMGSCNGDLNILFVVLHDDLFRFLCDFSQKEKLVLCSLDADVFVFHCFVIVFPCSLWPVVVYHFSIFLCVICR